MEQQYQPDEIALSEKQIEQIKSQVKAPSKLKGTKCLVKYRGPNGEGWSGRGRLPCWLVKAMEAGADRDSFRIGR